MRTALILWCVQDENHELLWTSPLRLLQAVDVALARFRQGGSEAALLLPGQTGQQPDSQAALQELREDVVDYL